MNNTTQDVAFLSESISGTAPRYWVTAPFMILILTTCVANIIVVIITSTDSKLKGVTYMYVTSLAVADFMVCMLYIFERKEAAHILSYLQI